MFKDIMLMTHFIGLGMILGAGFAMMFQGMAAAKMEKEDAGKFMLNSLGLMMMGKIGITLLVLSGLFLMMPYLSMMATLPMFHVKLTLVAILLGLIVVQSLNAKKAKAEGGGSVMLKMAKMDRMMLVLTVLIVVFAVLAFH